MFTDLILAILMWMGGWQFDANVAWYGENEVVLFPVIVQNEPYLVMSKNCEITEYTKVYNLQRFADSVAFQIYEGDSLVNYLVRTLYMHPTLNTPVMHIYREGVNIDLELVEAPSSVYPKLCSQPEQSVPTDGNSST